MSRIPLVSADTLTPDQRRVYDKIISGPRGVMVGPLRAALHSPDLADRWQALGEFLRYRTTLHVTLTELAILAVARHWNCEVEWLIHAHIALGEGVPEDIVESIRKLEPPSLRTAEQVAVYEFARELLARGNVSDRPYDEARRLFGDVGVVELTGVVGYYTLVAMTLSAHHIPPPEVPGRGRPLEGGPWTGPSALPPPLPLRTTTP